MQNIKGLLTLTIAAVLFLSCRVGLTAPDSVPPPPYVFGDARGVVIGVTWETAGVLNTLPKGVSPVKDFAGGIVIYETGQGYGLGQYTSAYFYVNVEGYDSREGTKANWMLQGIYGPDARVAKALGGHYHLPVRTGLAKIEKTQDGHRYTATVNGKDIMSAQIRLKGECAPAQAFENYPGLNASTGEITLLEIPEVGNWCDAEVITIAINPPADDPFSIFKVKSVDWAGEFRDWSFSFTKPIVLGKR